MAANEPAGSGEQRYETAQTPSGPTASTVFDRVADVYDRTRGGEQRAEAFSRALAPRLPAGPVFELGVGTGIIAAALRAYGHRVVGVDLSTPMLRHAATRLPGAVARADAQRLPVGDARLGAVVSVWVLHVVGDLDVVLAEVARILRAAGTYLVIASKSEILGGDTDVERVLEAASLSARQEARKQDDPALLLPAADRAGLRFAGEHPIDHDWVGASPSQAADSMSSRIFSWLWRLDDAAAQEVVDEALPALRRLPDQDRPRQVQLRYRLFEFARPA